MVWGLWCIAKHISDRQPKLAYLGQLLEACSKIPSQITQDRLSLRTLSALRKILFILIWTPCFGYHIYLYSIFFRNKLVSRVWTFGQIIAVTVWAPAIVECFYIEYSKLASFQHSFLRICHLTKQNQRVLRKPPNTSIRRACKSSICPFVRQLALEISDITR